jgi:hypothetical protein
MRLLGINFLLQTASIRGSDMGSQGSLERRAILWTRRITSSKSSCRECMQHRLGLLGSGGGTYTLPGFLVERF